jgi:hypothetical protein
VPLHVIFSHPTVQECAAAIDARKNRGKAERISQREFERYSGVNPNTIERSDAGSGGEPIPV